MPERKYLPPITLSCKVNSLAGYGVDRLVMKSRRLSVD